MTETTRSAASSGRAAELPIYILLPVHNRRATTERFLKSFAGQTDQNYRLIVIDDGSTDGTSEMVAGINPGTTVIRGSGNLWWAGSLQRGFEWLKAEKVPPDALVLLINDDTAFSSRFLASGRAAMGTRHHAMLLAQLCEPDPAKPCLLGAKVDWRDLQFTVAFRIEDIDCFSTRGLFLRMEDLVAIGGFRPRLLPHYLSDYEFTIRARRARYQLLTDPEVRLEHGTVEESATAQPTRLRAYLRTTFSNRSPDNPLRWTMFILLACPRRFVLHALARTWFRFFRETARVAGAISTF
jgi:GT2 family glycosyltransferase